MEMTHAQRLILSNQYTLMSQLDNANAEHYERLKTIVERGYDLQIKELTRAFDCLPEEQCQTIISTMDMFHAMQESHHMLSKEAQNDIDARRLRFLGYDAVTETQAMNYVRFLVHTEQRYPQFLPNEHEFNSQVPMADKYQKMLAVWQQCPRQYHLSVAELHQILNA
ncbi:YfbU family protein [Vibrio zhugei]|uniref:UPF0304 protein ACFODT_16920 n=1 Tax=Vibrio zhugei TaxID=2479546 RepID=A0ABV7CBT5_9VIBR|nr:YfbU family protein [Vibrio zhugei]